MRWWKLLSNHCSGGQWSKRWWWWWRGLSCGLSWWCRCVDNIGKSQRQAHGIPLFPNRDPTLATATRAELATVRLQPNGPARYAKPGKLLAIGVVASVRAGVRKDVATTIPRVDLQTAHGALPCCRLFPPPSQATATARAIDSRTSPLIASLLDGNGHTILHGLWDFACRERNRWCSQGCHQENGWVKLYYTNPRLPDASGLTIQLYSGNR